MTSPSRPVNINSPRRGAGVPVPGGGSPAIGGTPISGTPDLRALRAAYSGTPPPANIPTRAPRSQDVVSGTPGLTGAGAAGEPSPQTQRLAVGGISARRPGDVYGTPGSDAMNASSSAVDLEDLPDEEKAKVLRRHLVSKDNRAGSNGSEGSEGSASTGPSRKSSNAQLRAPMRREETEVFPVPYHAPGADVTYVFRLFLVVGVF